MNKLNSYLTMEKTKEKKKKEIETKKLKQLTLKSQMSQKEIIIIFKLISRIGILIKEI